MDGILQGEGMLVEVRSVIVYIRCGSLKKFGTGLRMTCPRSEEKILRAAKFVEPVHPQLFIC
jgi:hypothetical protein